MEANNNRIKEILSHFPDLHSLVYYVVDTVMEEQYEWGGEVFDFCKEESEKFFWKNNILNFPHLFTAAILKYEGDKNGCRTAQKTCLDFLKLFHQEISEEGLSFSIHNSNNKRNTVNITDFLYSKPEFNLKNKDSQLIQIHKEPVEGKNHIEDGGYGIGYQYSTYKNGKQLEVVKYNIEQDGDAKLYSNKGWYTSKLKLEHSDMFFDVKDVLSFAKSCDGYVYVIMKDNKYYLGSQGFGQLSRLIRPHKQPVYVKAHGAKVIALMNDGTLTSNFGIEQHHVLKAWFNEEGVLKTEKEK